MVSIGFFFANYGIDMLAKAHSGAEASDNNDATADEDGNTTAEDGDDDNASTDRRGGCRRPDSTPANTRSAVLPG
jgi:hypothetical protein